jgi:3-hexulose-6-phosphate synthase
MIIQAGLPNKKRTDMDRSEECLLQLAVDTLDLASALRVADQVHPHYDILEIGTPLIIEEGLRALEAIKSKYPDKHYLADLKIMDAGRMEAESAFKRGADIVTVLALADDRTIQGAVDAAKKYGGQIMADLINTPDPAARAEALEDLGTDVICVHTAHDVVKTGADPMSKLRHVRERVQCRLGLAGGLNWADVEPAVMSGADVLVIGSGITAHPSPSAEAARVTQQIQEICRCRALKT